MTSAAIMKHVARAARVTVLSAGLLGLVGLSGCASMLGAGPAETVRGAPEALPVPATLGATAVAGEGGATAEASNALQWDTVVQDPRLRQVIAQALENNRDLRLAGLRIDQARAQLRIASSDLWPTVNGSAGQTTTRTSAEASSSGTSSLSRQYSVSLGVSAWELDLWGRLRELKDSAQQTFLATEQTRQSAQGTLVAEVAQAWLTLDADQQLLVLARQTLDSRTRSLALVERQRSLGSASGLDVSTARIAAETARGVVASARTQVAQDLNALRLLVGAEPEAQWLPTSDTAQAVDARAPSVLAGASGVTTASTPAVRPASLPVAALVTVPAELPSTALLRRADVRSAERSLRAAQADVAAARAALFPTVSLTASAGTASSALSGLFAAGSGAWSLAPSIRLPLIDGGATRASLDSARVAREIALTTYEQTVQTAFREVSDALATRADLAERLAAQEALVRAGTDSLALTERRRALGAESALAVLDAQRTLWSAQQSLIALRLTEQANRLTLFKVLGGS